MEELDCWEQITEEEARLAYDDPPQRALGRHPVVRRFEQRWRELVSTRYAITTMNAPPPSTALLA